MEDVFWGLMIPLLGTTLGAACVFFMRGRLHRSVQRGLTGFASGVMVAASFFSLLLPALEQSAPMGQWAFLLLLDHIIPHLHMNAETAEGPRSHLKKTTMLILAVTLHNIPEGMAVGVVYAGVLAGSSGLTAAGAMALSAGIAIQNFPEGAIISMPLKASGMGSWKSFFGGFLSGVVEPVGAIVTILLTSLVVPLLPGFLSFAAGAMIYVVVEELIPEMSAGEHSDIGVVSFAVGFMVMMALDVALG